MKILRDTQCSSEANPLPWQSRPFSNSLSLACNPAFVPASRPAISNPAPCTDAPLLLLCHLTFALKPSRNLNLAFTSSQPQIFPSTDLDRPMKVEIIVDPARIPPPPLSTRVAPAPKQVATARWLRSQYFAPRSQKDASLFHHPRQVFGPALDHVELEIEVPFSARQLSHVISGQYLPQLLYPLNIVSTSRGFPRAHAWLFIILTLVAPLCFHSAKRDQASYHGRAAPTEWRQGERQEP